MKKLLAGLIFSWSLFLPHSAAQRGGGGHSGGFGGGGFAGGGFHGGGFITPRFRGFGGFRGGNIGLPPVGPIPPLGSIGTCNRFGNCRLGWLGWGYPGDSIAWGYPDDFNGQRDEGYYDSGSQNPMIVMPQESYGPTVVQAPPPPVRPELHEYNWPESETNTVATFTIIGKSGSAHSAIAVWVQGDAVRYITPDGTGGRLPLDSVNREATRSANAAKHLTLSLPAASRQR
jgi:hypothetical protein